MSDPFLLSECKKIKMDQSGLMKYANELSEEEKARFIFDKPSKKKSL